MTRAILERLAKAKKFDLSHFTDYTGCINDNFTKVEVTLSRVETINGLRATTDSLSFSVSISAIYKRGENPMDYDTLERTLWIKDLK